MIEILNCTNKDIRDIAKILRRQDEEEVLGLGMAPLKACFYAYRNSVYRKTGFINGGIAACWGVSGTPLSLVGRPWLVTTDKVYDIPPIKFAKIYKKEALNMLRLFPVLENYVDARYLGAVRMLEIAGFVLKEQVVFNTVPFIRFEMKEQN